ncbi:MAG TPA: voltage-gated chloride channel, partial [Pseudoalteromonas sp.]|nr:voltage-gated chloride channel [Pseudoalteromonas sp.]
MWLEQLRRRLAKPKTSVQLCLLGVSAGLIAAFFIILFRLTILFFQSLFLDTPDNFTTIPTLERVLMPLIAALLIATFAAFTGFKHYRLGIPFVIHR